MTKKIFKNSDQLVIVRYASDRVYTICSKGGKLTALDTNLKVVKEYEHKFKAEVRLLEASEKYVAVGDGQNVTIFLKSRFKSRLLV